MIAHKPIRQDNRVFWHISQVYKSTSAMRSRAPPSTPTLAGPTQQPYQDLGPSPHARRQIETGQEPTRSDTDTPGSTAASYQCCPARCATRQPSPLYYSMHPFYTIVRAASHGLQRYPSSHQRAYAARAYPRPLHQLTDATRILFTQHQRHYVQHHLDVCTVTALIDKQAFSDSIANRVRELSWGPNTTTAHLPAMPFAQESHHAFHADTSGPRPTLSNLRSSISSLVPKNGRNYRTGHASFGSAAQPPCDTTRSVTLEPAARRPRNPSP